MPAGSHATAEYQRLEEDAKRTANWKRWGPYLSERQWGTVREDYSATGDAWNYFPHDHARSRAYRWGEDGLLGFCDRECRLCFSLTLWNGKDSILKERLFGLTGPEGNHGEDVKEVYFYLDSTPTHSYMKGLYKYPQAKFPYEKLVQENKQRTRGEPEFEVTDSGVFDDNHYFDVIAEYAKASPNDILIKITAANRSSEAATLHLLPTLWFRNTWAWGSPHEAADTKPRISLADAGHLIADHATLGRFHLHAEPFDKGDASAWLFTENETNNARLFGAENYYPSVKDAFHNYVIRGRSDSVNPAQIGTKAAAYYPLEIRPGGTITLRLRLHAESETPADPLGPDFDKVFKQRLAEADEFYASRIPPDTSTDARLIVRQAYAGLLWSKQFYNYVIEDWLKGDPAQPPPPRQRLTGRNSDWPHLYNRDVISMPDKWEYPWYAAWDLAFHMIPLATIDPDLAKEQLLLFLREWYMHPNGQLPAYEFNFSDVNPPVHAWACWRVYKMTAPRGQRDRVFLARAFQKLLINFTWWVNRKDLHGKHVFAGGFLGLDNIGLFDRSRPLPTGGHLDQADGTAWMAFYCATMLAMALELATEDPTYEDVASKFFEHFIAIVDAMNTLGGTGLWDENDGFYYDQLATDGRVTPLRIRSMVGIIPLFACEVLDHSLFQKLPGFAKRTRWFLENRKDLARNITYLEQDQHAGCLRFLLAIPSRQRLERVLRYVLSESEFLSPFGLRSLSAIHKKPYTFDADGARYSIRYVPGESDTALFGGNSNWRGPIWFPVNYLLIEALERYHYFYGDGFSIECPTGSGQMMTLKQIAAHLASRLNALFLPDANGNRPYAGGNPLLSDPHWKNHLLFHEFFHGDTGKGLGASHQTGWTALCARLLTAHALPSPGTPEAGRGEGSRRAPQLLPAR